MEHIEHVEHMEDIEDFEQNGHRMQIEQTWHIERI